MFFLWIIIGIIILDIMIIYSTIKIELKDFEFILTKEKKRYINENFEIIIKLYILKKIKIVNLKIPNDKINKNQIEKIFKNIDIPKDKKDLEIEIIDIFKNLNINLEKIKLKLYLGTEDAAITAILIGIISTILGIYFKFKLDDLENVKFETIPIYIDKNYLKIYFDGIFRTNMIHIIYIIYILKKKRRVDKNVRTSNRRSYAYSDE